jgi:hypothetical protein
MGGPLLTGSEGLLIVFVGNALRRPIVFKAHSDRTAEIGLIRRPRRNVAGQTGDDSQRDRDRQKVGNMIRCGFKRRQMGAIRVADPQALTT